MPTTPSTPAAARLAPALPMAPTIALLAALLTACGNSGSGTGGMPDGGPATPLPPLAACESTVNPEHFASADELLSLNAVMDRYGLRSTASPAHQAYVQWLDDQLAAVPGMQMRRIDYTINRWTETGRKLEIGTAGGGLSELRTSNSMPYAQATPAGGISAPLVYVPADVELDTVDLTGKILVRDIGTVVVPNAALAALEWFTHDPDNSLTLDVAGNYEREAMGELGPENEAAHAAGAVGVIFVHGFPHAQANRVYAPYEGLIWPVPALYVGSDEGEVLKALAAQGGVARLTLTAEVVPAQTKMVIGTLPGESPERLVLTSHTDGVNALWDNGPPAMIAMARYFARFDQGCRPRTLEFAFTTSHLHQRLVPPARDGSAEQYARELDQGYADGTVAAVVVIEHLGAKRYDAVARADGGPGRELVLSGIHEPNSFFVSESPALITALRTTVIAHDLERTIALRGADLPSARVPQHRSFGGEGGPYNNHLLPTIAFIVAPWTLFTTGQGLDGIDKDLMHRQMLLFTDLVYALGPIPTALLGGNFEAYRIGRDLDCGAGGFSGLYLCEGTPGMASPVADRNPSAAPPLRPEFLAPWGK